MEKAMEDSRGRFPNFLCIGAPRSGTTWLYQNLKKHPQAFVPENKEVSFFLPSSYRSNYYMGIAWYKSLFSFPNDGQIKAWGELTPRYYFNEGTPELIASLIPDIKLIFLLRHPVEMLYSLYMYHLKMYSYSIDFNRYKFHDYLDHHLVEPLGFYAKYLKNYYSFFPKDAILVSFYEDLKSDPVGDFKTISSFLAIDSSNVPQAVKEQVNTAIIPKNYGLHLLFSYLPRSFPFRKIINFESKYNQIGYKERKSSDNYITPELFTRLIKAFASDIHELETLLFHDLSHWFDYESLDTSMQRPTST